MNNGTTYAIPIHELLSFLIEDGDALVFSPGRTDSRKVEYYSGFWENLSEVNSTRSHTQNKALKGAQNTFQDKRPSITVCSQRRTYTCLFSANLSFALAYFCSSSAHLPVLLSA